MNQITALDDSDLSFPPVELALEDPDGLLAVGGNLSSERLILAYSQGIFPWYQDDLPILWWSPGTRMVLYPEKLHVSRSMRKVIKQSPYRISFDEAFDQVISQCAELRLDAEGTWITSDMQKAYITLHKMHFAHSVEVWEDNILVGGLYGIAMGQAFFGESMFSTRSNTSKLALIALSKQLQDWGYQLIDCQVPSEHLESLGAQEMQREDFMKELERLRALPGKQGPWHFERESL
ncbi:MAG: leucyl/phenylalanyl-tRNA--protein transferase [Pseudohongiellaceae bacterium]|nr:leucyl/phenylalanyl-tRNA--protein transferase [Pseudohongiellaceae bacterium]